MRSLFCVNFLGFFGFLSEKLREFFVEFLQEKQKIQLKPSLRAKCGSTSVAIQKFTKKPALIKKPYGLKAFFADFSAKKFTLLREFSKSFAYFYKIKTLIFKFLREFFNARFRKFREFFNAFLNKEFLYNPHSVFRILYSVFCIKGNQNA